MIDLVRVTPGRNGGSFRGLKQRLFVALLLRVMLAQHSVVNPMYITTIAVAMFSSINLLRLTV